jgi:tetratricopeptide (TPR) repeat protein
MTETENSCGVLSFLIFVLLTIPAPLLGQSDVFVDPAKAAQAKTEGEFDKYLEIVTASDPHQIVSHAEAFVVLFPHSELSSAAYRYKMQAYEQLNDFDGMLAAGRQALVGNPDDASTLLALATAMASRAAARSDREALLSEAERDARHALEEVEKAHLSRKVSMQEWTQQKHQMQSEAYGALGVVSLERKQTEAAARDFTTAISLSPQPQGIQFLRLGLAYSSMATNTARAAAQVNFRRAAELGPEAVRKSALSELTKLTAQSAQR